MEQETVFSYIHIIDVDRLSFKRSETMKMETKKNS